MKDFSDTTKDFIITFESESEISCKHFLDRLKSIEDNNFKEKSLEILMRQFERKMNLFFTEFKDLKYDLNNRIKYKELQGHFDLMQDCLVEFKSEFFPIFEFIENEINEEKEKIFKFNHSLIDLIQEIEELAANEAANEAANLDVGCFDEYFLRNLRNELVTNENFLINFFFNN
jgi:hypothetical protein